MKLSSSTMNAFDGVWRNWGFRARCNLPNMKDHGDACFDPSDCYGSCVSEKKGSDHGVCSYYEFVTNGRFWHNGVEGPFIIFD